MTEQPNEAEASSIEPINPHNLPADVQTFLMQGMSYALMSAARTPEDFLGGYPPRELLTAYAKDSEAYVDLLIGLGLTTHRKVAKKKDPLLAAEDLETALNEKDIKVETVLELLEPRDCARLLRPAMHWAILSNVASGLERYDGDETKEREFAGYLLETAFELKWVTAKDFLDIAFETFIGALDVATQAALWKTAFSRAATNEAFDEEAFIVSLTTRDATEIAAKKFPLSAIWSFLQIIAEIQGFTGRKEPGPASIAVPPLLDSSTPPPAAGSNADEVFVAEASIAPPPPEGAASEPPLSQVGDEDLLELDEGEGDPAPKG